MRRPKLWAIAVALLSLLALPVVILGGARLAAERTLERLEREMEATIARRRSEGHARPPLFEDPLPGGALDHYGPALSRLQLLTDDQKTAILEIPYADPREDLGPSGALRSAARICAEAVVLGLRCSRLHRLRDYELGMAGIHNDRLLELGDLLLAGAELERRAGNSTASLPRLTALAGLYGDATRGVEVYGLPGLHLLDSALRIWKGVLKGPPLPAEELDRAVRALGRIEAALPTPFDALRIQHDLERIDLLLAYRGRQSNWASAAEPSWKHGYSKALLTREMLRALERQQADLHELARRPLRERVAAARELDREYFDGPQIGEGRLWMGFQESLWRDVLIRLHLRLTRAATAIAAHEAETGRLPAALEELVPRRLAEIPVCPLSGAPFRYADGRLWAFGFDGDDDAGRPVPEDKYYEDDGDVVWTLRKR